MKYRIQTSYCWYECADMTMIVKMYFINYVAFTFDDIPSVAQEDPDIIAEANGNVVYTDEQLFRSAAYLAEEMATPLLYDMELENPEDLPVD